VVAVAFQSAFRVEMHQNDIFLFFKNHFLDQRIKTIQNIQKNLFLIKKQFEFFKNTGWLAFPNTL
jgi:hypothetical protein